MAACDSSVASEWSPAHVHLMPTERRNRCVFGSGVPVYTANLGVFSVSSGPLSMGDAWAIAVVREFHVTVH